MSHRRAKLTPFGRQLLVQRVVDLGWTPAQAATSAGVSRATAYKWLARYRDFGVEGLEDRSSRPRISPKALPNELVQRILKARQRWRTGPHHIGPALGHPRSTVYAVLRRHGLSRLRDNDRSTGIPVRYVREHPGELLHLDMKKLGRIPAGGGHRFLGREQGRSHQRTGTGYEYVHVAVDDCSRVAFAEILADDTGATAAQFLLRAGSFYAAQGVRIQRVMTDRAKTYTLSADFAAAVQALGATHKLIRPYHPQTNGKAERFIQTMLREWAYARFYPNDGARADRLPGWLRYYNRRRPHSELNGRPPLSVLVNNVLGNYI
jgi:transposase InsO family protein